MFAIRPQSTSPFDHSQDTFGMFGLQPANEFCKDVCRTVHPVSSADSVKLKDDPCLVGDGRIHCLLQIEQRPVIHSDTEQPRSRPRVHRGNRRTTLEAATPPGDEEVTHHIGIGLPR